MSALCQMTGLSRAGFYRSRTPRQVSPIEMEVRDEMQKIAVESPAYGYRRITAELRHRGFAINRKRVLRMMREDNLLCVRRRAFVVTTDSQHNLPVYPNLAGQMKPTAINQLGVADITYIRLRTEFVYLAVVLDAFSRRVIGWALGRTLEAELAVSAFAESIAGEKATAGVGAPLRSRSAVRFGKLYRTTETTPGANQHEPQGQPLRQRRLRVLHEDPETRRGLPQ